MGFWFRNNALLCKSGIYSFISVAAVFLSGGLAAASIATGGSAGGLIERITIGGYLQWLLIIALMMFSSETTSALPVSEG